MLPPPPINRLPLGLLDAFGIKTGGQYPGSLAPQVNLACEQMGFLFAPLARIISATNAGILGSGFTGVGLAPIPNDQLWVVRNISIRVTAGAASAIYGHLAYQLNGLPSGRGIALNPQQFNVTAGEQSGQGIDFAGFNQVGRVFNPGTAFGLNYFNQGVNGATASIDIDYVPLLI